jgi:hypothetical protein
MDKDEVNAAVARFWSRFYAESMRLFGDKKGGTLQQMTDKAMQRIGLECLVYAAHPERDEAEHGGRFDIDGFREHCDQCTREGWSARRIPWQVVSAYLELIQPMPEQFGGKPPMSRRDAVEEVARRFRFPSFNACYQYLKLQKVPLPPNWPSP